MRKRRQPRWRTSAGVAFGSRPRLARCHRLTPQVGDRGKHLASERSAADRDDLRLLDQRSDGLGRLLCSGPSGLTEQSLEMPDRIASDSGADLVAEHQLEARDEDLGFDLTQ